MSLEDMEFVDSATCMSGEGCLRLSRLHGAIQRGTGRTFPKTTAPLDVRLKKGGTSLRLPWYGTLSQTLWNPSPHTPVR